MDAADRATLATETQEARHEGRRARDNGTPREHCPYADHLETAWHEGWDEQDRNVQAR